MKMLAKDTLYYRHDHPDGYLFAAGNAPADPAEGWVGAPHLVGRAPAKVFSYSTMEAFEEGLQAERRATARLTAGRQELFEALKAAEAEVEPLRAENAQLRRFLASLIAHRKPRGRLAQILHALFPPRTRQEA
jgi:hypothetical protein